VGTAEELWGCSSTERVKPVRRRVVVEWPLTFSLMVTVYHAFTASSKSMYTKWSKKGKVWDEVWEWGLGMRSGMKSGNGDWE